MSESPNSISSPGDLEYIVASGLFSETYLGWERMDDYLFLIDVQEQTAEFIQCKNTNSNRDCWAYRPEERSQWVVFNIGSGLLARDLSGQWWTITGEVFNTGEWSLQSWLSDSNGIAIASQYHSCDGQSSLYYLDFLNQTFEDWSALPCNFDQPESHFIGSSPDGTQVAFAWGEDALERLSICPAEALEMGCSDSCYDIFINPSSDNSVIRFSRYRIGNRGGNVVGWLRWQTNSQFIWVNSPQSPEEIYQFGTLDLLGQVTVIERYSYSGIWYMHNIRLNGDGNRILYDLDYYDTLHIFDFLSGENINLGVEDRLFGANWLFIP